MTITTDILDIEEANNIGSTSNNDRTIVDAASLPDPQLGISAAIPMVVATPIAVNYSYGASEVDSTFASIPGQSTIVVDAVVDNENTSGLPTRPPSPTIANNSRRTGASKLLGLIMATAAFAAFYALMNYTAQDNGETNYSADDNTGWSTEPEQPDRREIAAEIWNEHADPLNYWFLPSWNDCISHPDDSLIYGYNATDLYRDMALTMIAVYQDERLTREVEAVIQIATQNDVLPSECIPLQEFSVSIMEPYDSLVPLRVAQNLTEARLEWLIRTNTTE